MATVLLASLRRAATLELVVRGSQCSVARCSGVARWPLGRVDPTRLFVVSPRLASETRGEVDTAHAEAIALVEAVDGWSCVGGRQLRVKRPGSRRFLGKGQIENLAPELRSLVAEEDGAAAIVAAGPSLLDDELLVDDATGPSEGEVREYSFDHEDLLLLQGTNDDAVAGTQKRRARKPNSEQQHAEGAFARPQATPLAVFVNVPMLRPTQQQTLQDAWGVPVLDRFLVVLSIFRSRANSREALLRLQLAAIGYERSRLVDTLANHEQQRGATGANGDPSRARDALFASLETSVASGRMTDGSDVLLVDTVGFVQGLSHGLVECFHATLQEALLCDLILLVVDASDPNADEQRQTVLRTLRELDVPDELLHQRIEVHNKCDLLSDGERDELAWRAADASTLLPVSAKTGEGCDELLAVMAQAIARSTGRSRRVVELPLSAPAQLSYLHRHPRIMVVGTEVSEDGECMRVTIEADEEAFLAFAGQRWA